MTYPALRVACVASLVALCCTTASAQQAGGGGGATGGGGAIGATTGIGDAMNADVAFGAIQRGPTVGSTGLTGAGFSNLSAANQGGAGRLGGGIGGLGGARGFGAGGMGGFGGLNNLFGGMNAQNQQNKPTVRTRLQSAVAVNPTPPQQVAQRAGRQILSLPQANYSGVNGVSVTMDGRRATLSGVVTDERQRRMVELMVRLEPGISDVDNQLAIESR